MALNLAIRILGGEGANRLHQVLRTERGLTYGASADFDTLKESGAFEASTNTRSEATGEVLRLMVDEFWRLQRERVGERELADAKAYLTGSFPLTIETPDAIATQVLNVLFYGLPVEQLESFRQRVNAVSVDEVERVARFFLRPDRLSIVLVGQRRGLRRAAAPPRLRQVRDHRDGDLDLTTADFKKPRRLGRADSAEPSMRSVSSDVRRASVDGRPYQPHVRHSGRGRRSPRRRRSRRRSALSTRRSRRKAASTRFAGSRAITAVTQASMATPEGRVEAQTTTYLQYPNHMRVETMLAGHDHRADLRRQPGLGQGSQRHARSAASG